MKVRRLYAIGFVILGAGGVLWPHTGFAFSIFRWPVHEGVTRAAAAQVGVAGDTLTAIAGAVMTVDGKESTIKPVNKGTFTKPDIVLQTIVLPAYVESHHADRGAGTTHAAAFTAATQCIRDERDATVTQAQAAQFPAAMTRLGQALHALEDLHSHSNLIDLGAADQAAALAAIWTGAAPPAALAVAAFFKAAADPGKPADPLNYTHDARAKDRADFNAEAQTVVGTQTKFEIARDLAIASSVDLLNQVIAQLTPAQVFGLLGVGSSDLLYEDDYVFKVESACPVTGCTLTGSGTTVVFPSGALAQSTTVAVLGVPYDFFHHASDVLASDGAAMAVIREIRPVGESFAPPAEVSVGFTAAELLATDGTLAFEPSTFAVYYADESASDWVAISGTVTYDSGNGTGSASFYAPRGGLYAIGASLVQTPSVPALPGGPLAFLILAAGLTTAAIVSNRRRAM